MPESKLTQAQRRFEQASEALNALLEEGASPEQTTKARDTLAAAERALKAAEATEVERQKKLEAEQTAEAEKLAAELAAEIGAKMAEIIASVSTPNAPRIETAKAAAILKARQEAAQTRETLDQAKAKLDTLEERHSELSQQWDVISSRRAQGDTRDTDTGELVTIAADRDGIERLIERAQEAVNRANLDHARAAETLKSAERRWIGVVSSTWRQAMLRVAEPLEAALAAAADEILNHRDYRGDRPRGYAPELLAFRRHLEAAGFTPWGKRHAA